MVYRQRNSTIGSCSSTVPIAAGTTGDSATADSGSPPAPAAGADTAPDTAGDAQLAARLTAGGDDVVQVQLHPQLLRQLQQLPEVVHQRVLQLHQEFEQACRNHSQMKQDGVARVQQRQQVG